MKRYIDNSKTYKEYMELVEGLVRDGKTSGPNQSESLADFTRLNLQRMKRLEKTIEVAEGPKKVFQTNDRQMIWLIITEAWCGDAAQNIPVIEKIAAESDMIETRYILRDENLELIDLFLTNGTRSIPKLISLDRDSLEVLGTWGARPAVAQKLFLDLKDKGIEKPEIIEQIQRWYNDDKGRSLQAEFAELLRGWNVKRTASAGA